MFFARLINKTRGALGRYTVDASLNGSITVYPYFSFS